MRLASPRGRARPARDGAASSSASEELEVRAPSSTLASARSGARGARRQRLRFTADASGRARTSSPRSRRSSPSCAMRSRRSRARTPSWRSAATLSPSRRRHSPKRERALAAKEAPPAGSRRARGADPPPGAGRPEREREPQTFSAGLRASRSAACAAAGRRTSLYTELLRGALAQLGERRVCNAEVAGSIPARSTAVGAGQAAPTSRVLLDGA